MQGVAFALAGLGSMAEAWRIEATVRGTATFDALGPDRYLMLAGGLMVLAGVLLTVVGRGPVERAAAAADGASASPVRAAALPAWAVMVAALAGFAAAMPWAGFEAGCLGFFLVAFGVVSRWSPLRSLIGAAAAVAALHVVFVRLADVPLPRGVWRAWLDGG